MRPSGMFDMVEFGKRIRRLMDVNYSYRKLLVLLVISGAILLYLGPSFAQWLFSSSREPIEGTFVKLSLVITDTLEKADNKRRFCTDTSLI